MARKKAQEEEEDLVPYYRPGTTEPEMVPRSSVPGYEPEDESDGSEEDTQELEEPESTKKAVSKPAKKK